MKMSPRTFAVENEARLADAARTLAPFLRKGDVIALRGELGAGKTAFARALVNALSPAPEEVPSPTFTLVQVYDLPELSLWHFDLYRVEREDDILELGWEEARRSGAVLVEWPERLGSLLPRDRLDIDISFVKDSDNMRILTLTPRGVWENRSGKE